MLHQILCNLEQSVLSPTVVGAEHESSAFQGLTCFFSTGVSLAETLTIVKRHGFSRLRHGCCTSGYIRADLHRAMFLPLVFVVLGFVTGGSQ